MADYLVLYDLATWIPGFPFFYRAIDLSRRLLLPSPDPPPLPGSRLRRCAIDTIFTLRVAKDQRIEFLASGNGPRLERARARVERTLNHSRRRSRKGKGSGPHVRSSEEDFSESDFSSSSGNSEDHEDQDGVRKRSDASAGSAGGGVGARGKGQGRLETKAYWPEAPPGVFASSTSEESEDFDACDGDASSGFGFEDHAVTRRHRPNSQARVGAAVAGVDVADVALKRVEYCNGDAAAAIELGVDATVVSTKTDLTARRETAGGSTSIEMNDTSVRTTSASQSLSATGMNSARRPSFCTTLKIPSSPLPRFAVSSLSTLSRALFLLLPEIVGKPCSPSTPKTCAVSFISKWTTQRMF